MYLSNQVCCIVCRKEYSIKGIHTHYMRAHTTQFDDINYRVQCSCIACKESVSTVNLNKHFESHFKIPPTIISTCARCGKDFNSYTKWGQKTFCSRSCANVRDQTDNTKKKIANTVRAQHKANPRKLEYTRVSQCIICNKWFSGSKKTCSNACLSIHAQKNAYINQLGKNGIRSGVATFTTDSYGNQVKLESRFESRCADILNDLCIKWIRPKALPYTLHNKKRRYYPDFFLPELNVYLDPKNDYLIEKDTDKINAVRQQHNAVIYVLSNSQLNNAYITSILQCSI